MLLSDAFPSVGFGTSGVRALVSDLQMPVVSAFVRTFARYVKPRCSQPSAVVAWDLRPSSPAIAAMAITTLEADGWQVEVAGQVPTPALALRCLNRSAAGVMITGSHIPFDRNGIKFYTPTGEILKADEQAIVSSPVDLAALPSIAQPLPAIDPHTRDEYLARYCLAGKPLQGLRVGVYQHSAVGRDLLIKVLDELGAHTVSLGRSDTFVPIDTEAVSDADQARAARWAAEHRLDAVVSTDGDGDRPWVCDAGGHFVRGDVLGLLTARYLGIQGVVTPVSSTTAIERSGWFGQVLRTRIGSPYVIEGMLELDQKGLGTVAGFEANGGFLLQHAVTLQQSTLKPLPTRDSLLPIVALLCLAGARGLSIAALLKDLPARATMADRLAGIPTAQSRALLQRLDSDANQLQAMIQVIAGAIPVHLDRTDGLRITTSSDDVIHLRPSGNAPELRVYTEASSVERARQLCETSLQRLPALLAQLA
jgi:phosphomannomutase